MLSICFHSGMSAQADLRGARDAKAPVGVVASKVSIRALLMALPDCLQEGVPVFIDSGAFHEVAEGVEPDWERVFTAYETVAERAEAAISHLYVVAPDKVGDQDESLARLTRYRDRVARLIGAGCRVIVPVQAGEISARDYLDHVVRILGTRDFVVGIPANKHAMPLEECATLRHPAFHILGRVQADEDQVARLEALQSGNPGVCLTADANWMRSRIKLISAATERERLRRQREGGLSPFTHPRSAAIAAMLLAAAAGGSPEPAVG